MSILSDTAKSCFEKSGGDVLKASRILEEAARADSVLFMALTESYLKQACYDVIRKHCQTVRDKIWTAPNYDTSSKDQKVRVLRHASILMEFPLPGGKRIGDANKAEVLQAVEFYRKQSVDMQVKSLWLNMIADKMSGRQVVRKALTEKQLLQLQKKAETNVPLMEAVNV